MSIIVSRFFLYKDLKKQNKTKQKKKRTNERTNEIMFRRLGNIKPETIIKEWIQAVLKSLSSCIHSFKFRVL